MKLENLKYYTQRWQAMGIKKKVLWFGLLCMILCVSTLSSLYILVGLGVFGELPSSQDIKNTSNPVASDIYAQGDVYLGSYFIENRSYLDSLSVSPHFKKALVAIEDHRFYQHAGIDYISLLRVLFKTILLQENNSGGGSTLSQQLAKNMFPRKRYLILGLLINKFREMHTARRIEKTYDKDKILWLYASTVSFGEQAFGLATASKRFFNKNPEDLLLEEAALLAGLLKATSYYNPRNYPERAIWRRNLVIDRMVKLGYLNEMDASRIKEKAIVLDYQPARMPGQPARYFKEYLKKEFNLIADTLRKPDGSLYNLEHDGLKLYTSLDMALQTEALEARNRYLAELQALLETAWSGRSMFGKNNRRIDEAIRNHRDYLKLKSTGLDNARLIDSFNNEEDRTFWTWNGVEEGRKTRIDSIKHYLKLLHNATLAVDPLDGAIRLYIGGNDFSYFQYDNIQARRQVGSLFKPVVYLAALQSGVEACDYYKNELIRYPAYDDWMPENADADYGGFVSVHEALAHSINTISVQLMFETGIDKVLETAQELGISSALDPVPSLVLGTSDISLFEMTGAYARIMNRGKNIRLHAIERIEDRQGEVIYTFKSPTKERIGIDTSYLLTLRSMMHAVCREGTGRRLYAGYNLPLSLAGKTGTTQDQADGWFIAGNERLVVGSWTGFEHRGMHFPDLASGSASRTALPVVGAVSQIAFGMGLYGQDNMDLAFFDCPGRLSDESYVVYKEEIRLDSLMAESSGFGGWLKTVFGKKRAKKMLNDRYTEQQIRKQLKALREERKKQLEDYDREIREWQTKLDQLEIQSGNQQ